MATLPSSARLWGTTSTLMRLSVCRMNCDTESFRVLSCDTFYSKPLAIPLVGPWLLHLTLTQDTLGFECAQVFGERWTLEASLTTSYLPPLWS